MANENHPINGLIDSALQNLRRLVDANTIIGQPIRAEDATIIPVSKVSFGFASGGSDLPTAKAGEPFGGGAGGGVTIQPLGFLVVQGGHVTLLQMNENKTTADRVVSLMPELVDKLGALLKKEKDPPQDPQA
ncbi:MAG TPA: GerW family sporulation protein [Candidatus Anaerotruncus excrementipullorum]|uniref:GerW family sporulation protein n=1 Tax=Candidatus Anaerotruncus excrementipullorum TaxID=2838465 RepID=A0A9D1WRB4_9FIRM|nr:GerW family sporulation protein [Candidatus Anaerotruncus excrementipullorum]